MKKIVAMRRTSYLIANNVGAVGAEPGVDVRRNTAQQLYGHIRQRCAISVIDYSPLRLNRKDMTNLDFIHWIRKGYCGCCGVCQWHAYTYLITYTDDLTLRLALSCVCMKFTTYISYILMVYF